jgi:hypothetical protein
MKMSRFVAVAMVLAVGMVSAQAEKGKGKGKKGDAAGAAIGALFTLPPEITLSDEQKTKLDALKTEWSDKLKTAFPKGQMETYLTDEQKAAAKTARAEAKSAGKKGKEAKEALDAAIKMTDEQKEKLKAGAKEWNDLKSQVEEKVRELLTDDQKSKMPAPKKRKNKKAD